MNTSNTLNYRLKIYSKTRTPYAKSIDDDTCHPRYQYDPKYFDIDSDYEVDEEKFTLMMAQHFIAIMIGFTKWADLLKASEAELELARLLFKIKSN